MSEAAEAQVAAAVTQRDLAQADWQRFSALKDQGFISGVELDRRKASLQSAQAQLAQAQAQASAQSNQSAYTKLLAPAAGVVTAVMAEPGQVVAAGSPVVQLAHSGPRDVVIAVPEDARAQFQQGQTVQVRLWAQSQELAGQVREIGASADPVTRTYAVKVAVQGVQQPDLGATAYVVVRPQAVAQQGLTVPSTAVGQQGGQSVVWVFDKAQSTVHARHVQLGQVDGNNVVIAQGIEQGAQVVVAGTHVLTEGQKVTVYQARHPEAAQ